MVEVYCAYDEMVDVSKLIPNPRNPNTHPDEQVRLLAKIIANQGWRCPITVSKRSGFVVRGHGRLQAAILAGLQTVPVDYQEYENEAAEWADLIADKRIAELSQIDSGKLKELFGELGEIDIEITGFSDDAFSEFCMIDKLWGDKESAANPKEAVRLTDRKKFLKAVIYLKDLGVIEKALSMTGIANRGEAIALICSEWIEKCGKTIRL